MTETYVNERDVAELRSRPGFREACEDAAARSIDYFCALPAPYQWLTKDLGRTAICLTAGVLQSIGALTVQSLVATCQAGRIASTGRVTQIVRRCEALGELTISPGATFWTRRPMRVSDAFVARLLDRARVELTALQALEPEATRILARLDATSFSAFIHRLALVLAEHRDRSRSAPIPMRIFLEREAGMLILYDLFCAQAPDRTRLLETAPLNRNALARRYGVSRVHINKLFDDAADQGLVAYDGPGDLAFSAELSEALEGQFAHAFLFGLLAGRAMLEQLDGRAPPADANVAPT